MSVYRVTLSGQKDYYVEKPGAISTELLQAVAAEAVAGWKLAVPRSNPAPVRPQVASLHVVAGELRESLVGSYAVSPPLRERTADEAAEECERLTASLPREVRAAVKMLARYRDLSGAGSEIRTNDDQVDMVRHMVKHLEQPLIDFASRLRRELTEPQPAGV